MRHEEKCGGRWRKVMLSSVNSAVCLQQYQQQQGGQILSPPKCFFAAIVKCQTVAGGDKLVKETPFGCFLRWMQKAGGKVRKRDAVRHKEKELQPCSTVSHCCQPLWRHTTFYRILNENGVWLRREVSMQRSKVVWSWNGSPTVRVTVWRSNSY